MISVFYFDRIPLVIGVAPKTGATTTLRFLSELQQLGVSREPLDVDRYLEQEAQTSIDLFENIGRFRLATDATVPSNVARVAVHRDPLERIASAWIDKILAWPALSYAFFDEPWFPHEVFGPDDLENKYKQFLTALEDHGWCRDDHWDPVIPQYGNVQFDKWVQTDALSFFCRVLVNLGVLPREWESRLLPALNVGSSPLLNFLVGGTQSWQLPSRYSQDTESWKMLQQDALAEGPIRQYEPTALAESELLREISRIRFKQLQRSGATMRRFHALQIERNELLTRQQSLTNENYSLSQSLKLYRDSKLATKAAAFRSSLPQAIRRFF